METIGRNDAPYCREIPPTDWCIGMDMSHDTNISGSLQWIFSFSQWIFLLIRVSKSGRAARLESVMSECLVCLCHFVLNSASILSFSSVKKRSRHYRPSIWTYAPSTPAGIDDSAGKGISRHRETEIPVESVSRSIRFR